MSRFARSYAQAFLGAQPAGFDVEGFLEKAAVIRRAIAADSRVKNFLAAPSVPLEAKRGLLGELSTRAAIDGYGRRLLDLILANRRILWLGEVLSAIRTARDRELGVVEAVVTVAAPVGAGQRDRIEKALMRQLQRRVRMRFEVNPAILGGFVARVGSEVFDASAARAIERFQEAAQAPPAP